MKPRNPLLIALCAASLAAVSIPVTSNAAVGVYFDVAPPVARVEVVPEVRHGYIWVPGYWDVRGNRHYWAPGHWERERHGHRYYEPRWTQRDNRWYLERGRWERGG